MPRTSTMRLVRAIAHEHELQHLGAGHLDAPCRGTHGVDVIHLEVQDAALVRRREVARRRARP